MALRLTPTKVKRWEKKIEQAEKLLADVADEVRAQKSNAMAKHYQPLCDVHAPLQRALAWNEVTAKQIGLLRP